MATLSADHVVFSQQQTIRNGLYRYIQTTAVVDEAYGDTDWAALQMQRLQAELAAARAIQLMEAQGAQLGSYNSDRYVPTIT